MTDFEENPWSVDDLDHFLYFCCPECNEKNQCRELFLEHALNEHPKAKLYLGNLEIKKEPYDENGLEIKLFEAEKQENLDNLDNLDSLDNVEIDNSYDYDVKREIEEIGQDDFSYHNDDFNDYKLEDNADLLNVKQEPNDKNHQCDICANTFTFQSNLISHIKRVHGGMKVNECKLCSKTFFTKLGLKRHEKKIHTGRSACEMCAKTFGQKSDLIKHIKKFHDGIKNYECKSCNKSFFTR